MLVSLIGKTSKDSDELQFQSSHDPGSTPEPRELTPSKSFPASLSIYLQYWGTSVRDPVE